ncbi:hypothetical protein TNCV_932511 [Trichonephila clavipes]|nr:hypothetical protein TNCV_932511 [Trichonephila clavipes]
MHLSAPRSFLGYVAKRNDAQPTLTTLRHDSFNSGLSAQEMETGLGTRLIPTLRPVSLTKCKINVSLNGWRNERINNAFVCVLIRRQDNDKRQKMLWMRAFKSVKQHDQKESISKLNDETER